MCALGHSGHTDKSAPCPLYPQSRRWLNALFGIVLDTVDRAVDGDIERVLAVWHSHRIFFALEVEDPTPRYGER